MIQANELRIGNHVIINDQSWGGSKAKEPYNYILEGFDIYKLHENTAAENGVFGIPLSPEILEKADFGHQWDDIFQHNESRIELCGSVEKGFRLLNGEMATNWDKTYFFLHEIQNLVFILSGIELQIQL